MPSRAAPACAAAPRSPASRPTRRAGSTGVTRRRARRRGPARRRRRHGARARRHRRLRRRLLGPAVRRRRQRRLREPPARGRPPRVMALPADRRRPAAARPRLDRRARRRPRHRRCRGPRRRHHRDHRPRAPGVLEQWLTALPASWQLTESTMTGPVTGARLATAPTSPRRRARGVLRVGDAAGTAHPVTGEGLAGALVSARVAADRRRRRPHPRRCGRARARAHGIRLASWTRPSAGTTGSAASRRRLLDRPAVARLATTYALPREALMTRALRHVTTARHSG